MCKRYNKIFTLWNYNRLFPLVFFFPHSLLSPHSSMCGQQSTLPPRHYIATLILGSKGISAQDEKMPWNPSHLVNIFSFHIVMLALTPCPRGQCSSGSQMGSFLVICQTQQEHCTEPSWPCRRVRAFPPCSLSWCCWTLNSTLSLSLHHQGYNQVMLGVNASKKTYDTLSRHLPLWKEHKRTNISLCFQIKIKQKWYQKHFPKDLWSLQTPLLCSMCSNPFCASFLKHWLFSTPT